MSDYEVTYDQAEFHREKAMVDWGVLVSENLNGGFIVCVVALKPDEVAKMLREAADSVEKASGDSA